MRAVISRFFIHKIDFFTKSLPATFIFLFFFVGCKSVGLNKHFNGLELRDSISIDAYNLIGSKYRNNGIEPEKGFDCSGLVFYIYNKNGLHLPHGSRSQVDHGTEVSMKEATIGDLIFFKKHGQIDHVGIIVKNTVNQLYVIHSTNSRGVVLEDVLNSDYWKDKIYVVKDVISK